MISSLTLDNTDEVRRAASRAASVRFDESANHYAPSRQSIDLPTRTGSGMGSHPLSERSLSHRSDGRGSTLGFGRTNSFGLEHSRLLGSIHHSPRTSGHPPPGLFILSPCPAIIRCWLSENFTNDSLFYAALCTGAASSSISLRMLQDLGLDGEIVEENGLKKIRLMVYLTEAKVHTTSSRSASPSLQVPTVTTKFLVDDNPEQDRSLQVLIGSDLLRRQYADILLSQDKIVLYDDDRNQISVPLVRPEDDNVYRYLMTKARHRSGSVVSEAQAPGSVIDQITPGIIGRPSRAGSTEVLSSHTDIAANTSSPQPPARVEEPRRILTRPNKESAVKGQDREMAEDPSVPVLATKSTAGVWSNTWRSVATGVGVSSNSDASNSSTQQSVAPRTMKVLRTGKSMANVSRTGSNPPTPTTTTSSAFSPSQQDRDAVSPVVAPVSTKSNPVGSGTAFGWLNSRRTTLT